MQPLRKISPRKAAITSYVNKIFITRSELVKHDAGTWLSRKVASAALDPNDNRVTEVQFGSNDIPREVKLPREYTALMTAVTKFTAGGIKFNLDYKNRVDLTDAATLKKAEKAGVVCGTFKDSLVVLDFFGNLSLYKDGKFTELSSLLKALGIVEKPPSDLAIIGVMGAALPVGLVLGYHLGIDGLFKKLGTKVTKLPASDKYVPNDDEQVIILNDSKLVIKVKSPKDRLIYTAFKDVAANLTLFSHNDLNRKEGFAELMTQYGANKFHQIELTTNEELFIDPITKELLAEMKEPTDLLDLYIRCVELITTDDSPQENDTKFQRLRRNERVVGFMYKEVVDAVKAQRRAVNPATTKVSIKPKAVWAAMVADNTTQLVNDANPIHQLKEIEAVSLAGEGGRTARTLVKRNRAYHPNDLGVISEAGPDSSKVGIRSYMPPNPKINNIYGMAGSWNEADGATSVLSTTSLVLPGMSHDDGKRMVLASVQQSAVVAAVGYTLMPLRTPYDMMLGTRTSQSFAFSARQDGVVTKVTDKRITFTYKDGKSSGVDLGVIHGVSAGDYVPHRMITDMVKGAEFKEGYVLAWNTGFFERDIFSPFNVAIKNGCCATIAFLEDDDVLEDGDAISQRFATDKMMTTTTKRKTFLLDTSKGIRDLVTVGTVVDFDTILCTIYNQEVEGFMDETTLASLRSLSDKSPKAKMRGTVTKVDMVFMGEPDNFAPSVISLIEEDSKERKSRAKDLGGRIPTTARIGESTFFGGEKVTEGTIAISVFIDHELAFSDGDKLVVANQLKSVCGRVMDSRNRAADGRPLDLKFAYSSQNARIVDSATIQGTCNTTILEVNRQMADIYFR